MEQRTQSLTDFIQQEQFELTKYVTHLFDYYKIGCYEDHTIKESYQYIKLGQV
ncbi:hypothetical protein [Bacillus dakarensis]|uniref:hypothetical protein n=1 Tax=Robertmurraya dakarensis TaxID=1926278 RepID=UPI0012B685D0|nr:hypothetical protein [Bacillus dakarensis]